MPSGNFLETPHVEILPDGPGLIHKALELMVNKIDQAIAAQGFCTLALSGGSTPKPLYAALAQQALPWDKLYIFWGDERYVPLDHPDSNAGAAKAVWLDQVPIPPDHIFAMPTQASDPHIAAAEYEQTLHTVFQTLAPAAAGMPQFDLILLGMGDDGHTASLFPHTPALSVRDRLITVGNKDGQPRLTFTVPLINQGKTVIFLAAGTNKQHALSQIFAPNGDGDAFPSRLIQPQGELWWLLDAAAAQPIAPG